MLHRSWSARLITGLVAGLAGCATATTDNRVGDLGVDAPPQTPQPDAPPQTPPPDAPPPCTPMVSELLVNGHFDATPLGTGWVEQRIDQAYELITPDDGNSGVTEQSPPNKVWLGGFAQANANDVLHQDIMVPANTTQLRLTGFFRAASSDSTTVINDTATINITNTAGTVLSAVLALDNTTRHTAWQPLDHLVPVTGLSGTTIRLRFASSNNTTLTTSFWFDTFSLVADHCQ